MTRERGTAVFSVMLVAALVAAAGLGALALGEAQVTAARRRTASAQARAVARAAVQAAAGWFEDRERPGLVAPPAPADLDRDRRHVDPDGDGTFVVWTGASPPWNVRYKEDRPADVFRPPEGPGPQDAFAGTPNHPDLLVGPGPRAALSSVLDPAGRFGVVRLAFFAPRPGGGAAAVAAIEAVVEAPLAGIGRTRATARGEVELVDWGRADRPLVVAGSAGFTGTAGWTRGEAVIGGELSADAAARASWPGGIPWAGPDRPVRDDADADGDGVPDHTQWRDLPGEVPDPWWRARVAGEWDGPAAPPGACVSPFPFGPRATPPAPPSKDGDRSGLFLRCPGSALPDPVPGGWAWLARRGPRWAWLAEEDPASPGRFRLDGAGPLRPPADFLPRAGGMVFFARRPGSSGPLAIELDGGAGAVLVGTGDLDIRGGARRPAAGDAPGDPRDTRGAERAGGADDDALRLRPAGGGCSGWDPGTWDGPFAAPPPAARHPCPSVPVHWNGWIAAPGAVAVNGPTAVAGQVRAGRLTADGGSGAVRLSTGPAAGDPGARPGPPGAPRLIVTGLRDVP